MKSCRKPRSTTFSIASILLMLFLITGCGGNPQPASTGTGSATPGYPATQQIDGYPAPQQVSGYPAPGDSTAEAAQGFTPMKTYAPGELPPAPSAGDPADGKGSISGVLFSTSYHAAIPKTMFYLAPGTGEKLDEVPPVITGPGANDLVFSTDENGEFNIPNIPPGVYYLIMSAPPYDWALGYQDTTPTLLKMTVEAGTKNDYGVIYIYWP